MRQYLTIILTIFVIVGLLFILNLASYVKDEKPRDLEITPNRSTYHSGPTGTRALYDFLSESNYKVMRWREVPEKLLGATGRNVATFVVIGRTQVQFTDTEAQSLLEWVMRGGRLVIIDRTPESLLLPQSGNWAVSAREFSFPGIDVDPSNTKEMTSSVTAVQPVQPTALTQKVQAVMPSRFAAKIEVTPLAFDDQGDASSNESRQKQMNRTSSATSPAPVVHLGDRGGELLVDYIYGDGRVIFLSDPYIVSNGGISLKDNLQLTINLLAPSSGLIAFDEFHQGRGTTSNAFATYFAGTPILPIGAQIALLTIIILWTRSRRFARPLPLEQVDRRSTLEFVASMSELQERSKAFDLAIENIYSRTRRVLARYAGVDYNSPRAVIAQRVASRSSVDAHELETLMRQCDEAVNGAPITWRQAIDLVRRLREVERSLGLRMRSRDARQAAGNI